MNKCENHRNRRSKRKGFGMLVLLIISITGLFALSSCDAISSRISDMLFYESFDTYSFTMNESVEDEIAYNYEDDDNNYDYFYYNPEEDLTQTFEDELTQAFQRAIELHETEKTDMLNDKTQMMQSLEEQNSSFLELTPSTDEDSDDDDYYSQIGQVKNKEKEND